MLSLKCSIQYHIFILLWCSFLFHIKFYCGEIEIASGASRELLNFFEFQLKNQQSNVNLEEYMKGLSTLCEKVQEMGWTFLIQIFYNERKLYSQSPVPSHISTIHDSNKLRFRKLLMEIETEVVSFVIKIKYVLIKIFSQDTYLSHIYFPSPHRIYSLSIGVFFKILKLRNTKKLTNL